MRLRWSCSPGADAIVTVPTERPQLAESGGSVMLFSHESVTSARRGMSNWRRTRRIAAPGGFGRHGCYPPVTD